MTKFAPGQSGNPGGRPKAVNKVRELIAERGVEVVESLFTIAFDPKEHPPTRLAAHRELLDRWLGKAPQQMDDGDGGPLVVKIMRFSEEP